MLPAGAHFTNRRRSPVPISKVIPPSSFTHTGRTGAVPASAATGAGTGRPGGGGPESITGAGTGEPGTPESMCLRWHGRQTARHAISGPAAGHEGPTAARAGWSAKLAVISAADRGELIVELVHSGKVRDVYADGSDLILVASDRVSVYDVVLPTPIPDKGRILTALSLWWFERLADIAPNHVISATDVPAEFAGRAVRCRRLAMVPVECIARGYLAGGGLDSYRATGEISGVTLPAGLAEGSRLPEPVFTPTTKAPAGEHDEPMTFAEVAGAVGTGLAAELRRVTLEVYRRGHGIALPRGIVIADTKLEFGRAPDGTLVLADEVLTSDSSRFWPAASWRPGRPQHAFDKQVVRDWSRTLDWDRTAPGPAIPPRIVEATRQRYIQAYEHITGSAWPPG